MKSVFKQRDSGEKSRIPIQTYHDMMVAMISVTGDIRGDFLCRRNECWRHTLGWIFLDSPCLGGTIFARPSLL